MKKICLRLLCLCFVIIFGIPLSACMETIPEYSYTQTYLRYIEDGGDRLIYGEQADHTQTAHAEYLFDTSLSQDTKNRCVYYTEQLPSFIHPEKIQVCILSNNAYQGTYLDGRILYTHQQDFRSTEYAADVLLAVFGPYCNYGLAYGYANYIARELGRDHAQTTAFAAPAAEYCCDLNLLCFSTQYVSASDVTSAKRLAIGFVDEYIKENGAAALEELLAASGDPEKLDRFNTVLGSWYEQNGVIYAPTKILYRHGGESYEFIANNDYAVFYVRKDWVEKTTERYEVISPTFLHENYAEVKEYFESNTESMTKLRSLFGLDHYFDPVSVCYKNTPDGTWFGSTPRTITLDAMCHLLHEYIHSLTEPYLRENSLWVSEGLSQYFSYYYEYPLALEYLNYDMNNCKRQSNTEIIFIYKAWLGRDIDLSKDVNELNDVITYYFGYSSPDRSYYAAASFLNYIIANYGEQTAIQYYLSHNGTFTELDKSFSTLTSEWKEYIESKYSSFPRHNG